MNYYLFIKFIMRAQKAMPKLTLVQVLLQTIIMHIFVLWPILV